MASELEKKLMLDILTSLVALLGVTKDPAICAACEECIEVIYRHVCGEDDERSAQDNESAGTGA